MATKRSRPVKSEEEDEGITRDFVLKKGNVIPFLGTDHFLSMMYKVRISLNGHNFASVEHYYQCTKLKELLPDETEFYSKMTKARAIHLHREVNDFLSKHDVSKGDVKDWKNRRSPAILFDGNKAKFDQNGWLKERLLDTRDKVLVNAYGGDDVFTSGSNRFNLERYVAEKTRRFILPDNLQCFAASDFPMLYNGRNVQGFILMELRNKYRAELALQKKLRSPASPARPSSREIFQKAYQKELSNMKNLPVNNQVLTPFNHSSTPTSIHHAFSQQGERRSPNVIIPAVPTQLVQTEGPHPYPVPVTPLSCQQIPLPPYPAPLLINSQLQQQFQQHQQAQLIKQEPVQFQPQVQQAQQAQMHNQQQYLQIFSAGNIYNNVPMRPFPPYVPTLAFQNRSSYSTAIPVNPLSLSAPYVNQGYPQQPRPPSLYPATSTTPTPPLDTAKRV